MCRRTFWPWAVGPGAGGGGGGVGVGVPPYMHIGYVPRESPPIYSPNFPVRSISLSQMSTLFRSGASRLHIFGRPGDHNIFNLLYVLVVLSLPTARLTQPRSPSSLRSPVLGLLNVKYKNLYHSTEEIPSLRTTSSVSIQLDNVLTTEKISAI